MRYLFLPFVLVAVLALLGCGPSSSGNKDEEGAAAVRCTELENPYDEGSGHYAGYEWAERNGSGDCNSSSSSFKEGCEEYERQESEYKECESRTKR